MALYTVYLEGLIHGIALLHKWDTSRDGADEKRGLATQKCTPLKSCVNNINRPSPAS